MTDFLTHHLAQGVYFVILMIPMGLLFSLVTQTGSLPQWLTSLGAFVGILYFIYAIYWATRAANLLAFQNKAFTVAFREARIQINVDLIVWLCFLPIIGPLLSRFTRRDKPGKPDTQPKCSSGRGLRSPLNRNESSQPPAA